MVERHKAPLRGWRDRIGDHAPPGRGPFCAGDGGHHAKRRRPRSETRDSAIDAWTACQAEGRADGSAGDTLVPEGPARKRKRPVSRTGRRRQKRRL